MALLSGALLYCRCNLGINERMAAEAEMSDTLQETSLGSPVEVPSTHYLFLPGYRYVIEGTPVSGKNHMQPMVNRKTGKRFMKIGKVAQTWQDDAIRQLSEQRTNERRRTIDGTVYVEYIAYQPFDRCDIDNMESALFDALKKALVIRDDKLIVDHRGRKAVDKHRPRFEVIVSPITPLSE